MKIIQTFLTEAKNNDVPFIVHIHDPRSGSVHFDLRFLDPVNPKLLHSFAFGKDFDSKLGEKIVGVKTKDHLPRWLTLQSYRLKTFDEGKASIVVASPKYYEIDFKGKKLNGSYKLFKLKTRKRDDQWLLIRSK